jgi:hypothetical protein
MFRCEPPQRGEEGHDPAGKQPKDKTDGVVAGEIVPDQQRPEWRELPREGDADGRSLLPVLQRRLFF